MKRRDFLKNSAGLAAGSMLPLIGSAQTKPCPPPTVQVAGGTGASSACAVSDAAGDWIARSTAPGVIWAQLFESDADVNNFRFTSGVEWDPNPAPGSVGSYVRRNPTGGIMGRGCMEMEQLTNGNMNSVWWRPFNPALTHYNRLNSGGDRTAGQGFYLQLRVKSNCAGAGSNGGGGRKVFSVSRTENSYTLQEIVAQDTWYDGIYQMYQGRHVTNGDYGPITTRAGESDFNLQPGSEYPTPPAYCSYQQLKAGSRSNCLDWGGNQWITFLWHIVPSSNRTSNGNITASYWKPGMSDYKKVIDYPNAWMEYEPSLPTGFNAVLLWIYETGRTGGPAGQKQWYDQVILSSSQIACPKV